jgi:hypothetical protein
MQFEKIYRKLWYFPYIVFLHLRIIEQISYECEKPRTARSRHGIELRNLLNQSYSARPFFVQWERWDTTRTVSLLRSYEIRSSDRYIYFFHSVSHNILTTMTAVQHVTKRSPTTTNSIVPALQSSTGCFQSLMSKKRSPRAFRSSIMWLAVQLFVLWC